MALHTFSRRPALLASVLLLAAVCAVHAGPPPTPADNVTVEYEGQNMTFTSVNTTPAFLNVNVTFVEQTPWWGNMTAALELCGLVNSTLGLPNNGYGPVWVVSRIPGTVLQPIDTFQGVWWDKPCDSDWSASVLDTTPYTFAEYLPADPSPGSGPNCSLAAFDPPILSSRLSSQVCTANKQARTGKTPALSTVVTLSLPPDAQNETASINITDVVMNSATASWKCRCRPTKRDNCSCIPNAVLLGGGSFRVMPQWRRFTRPGPVVDTTFQVSFTATTSGGSCSSTAVICASWDVRSNQPPPSCTPFNSTGVTRPALTCI